MAQAAEAGATGVGVASPGCSTISRFNPWILEARLFWQYRWHLLWCLVQVVESTFSLCLRHQLPSILLVSVWFLSRCQSGLEGNFRRPRRKLLRVIGRIWARHILSEFIVEITSQRTQALFWLGSVEQLLLPFVHNLCSSEWRLKSYHFIKNATRGPNLASVVIWLILPNLRTGIVWSYGLGMHHTFLGNSRDAEITYFDHVDVSLK
jgi:hypothetical protein